jgi:hypothetical protein
MNPTQVMSVVGSVSGRHIHVEFRSESKPAKEFKGHKLEKITSGAFRAGIDYANLGEVKEAIARGERGEVEPLPWGEWAKFPFHITHNEKNYLRLYPSTGGVIQAPKVTYFVDGVEVEKDAYYGMMTESARKPNPKPCFVVDMDNILVIGNEE